MTGGPSQLDMFDPKPALLKYAGQRPRASICAPSASPADCCRRRSSSRSMGANGVEVSELLPQLASVIDDVCVMRSMYTFNPDAHAGAQPDSLGQHLGDAAVDGLVDLLRAGDGKRQSARVRRAQRRAAAGRCGGPGFLPAEHQGTQIRRWRIDAGQDDSLPAQLGTRSGRAAAAARSDAGAQSAARGATSATTSFSKAASSRWRRRIRMQFAASDAFDIRKESRKRFARVRHDAVRHTAVCWRGDWWSAACAASTSITAPGSPGTTIRTSTRICASAAPTWIRPRRR